MGFAILLLPILLLLALAVGGVLLRAAVSLANKVLGPVALADPADTLLPISDPSASENPFAIPAKNPAAPIPVGIPVGTPVGNPYATPAVAGTGAIPSTPRTTAAIKEPSFGEATAIVFLQGITVGFTSLLTNFGGPEIGLHPTFIGALSFLVGVSITIAIFAGMLPTSFGRAALVYLFYVLIAIAMAIGIVLLVCAISAIFQLIG